uniref:Tower domain-containing protein n=1 Tax=Anopheles dirus TaxID=7168 RepID=A0A182NJM8_9DIPT
MEEVPHTQMGTEQCRKIRRKTGLSLKRPKKSSVSERCDGKTMERNVVDSGAKSKLSVFYFNENVEKLESVDANPLASAILLEKANAIAVPCKVPSAEFIACTNEEFLTVGELARRASTSYNTDCAIPQRSTSTTTKPHNYSFTQMEIDTQMIGIFDAAEMLSGSAAQEDAEKPPGRNDVVSITSKQNVSPARLIENNSPEPKQFIDPIPPGPRSIVQAILDDFRLDEGDDRPFEVDLSIIKSESLRRRLIQLQDLIASPPKAVKRSQVCRQYGGRVKQKKEQTLARRLSYDTDDSSRDGHPMSEDESDDSTTVRNTNDQSDNDASMDGMALNESGMIQANLTQLSAFFAQAGTSQTSEENDDERSEDKPNSTSIDREPTFYGFSSPISLASEREYSPKTVQFCFSGFSESDGECDPMWDEEESVVPVASRIAVQQLLEDDEDLFMLAHHPEEKQQSEMIEENKEANFSPAVNESNLKHERLPKTVLDSKAAKNTSVRTNAQSASTHDSVIQLREETDCVTMEPAKVAEQVPPFDNNASVEIGKPFMGGFSTAAGNTIAISTAALELAQQMFAEEELKLQDEETTPPVTSFGGGFSTAGGKTIAVSEKALEHAQQKFLEQGSNVDNETISNRVSSAGGVKYGVPSNEPVKACSARPNDTAKGTTSTRGFSTASGSTIFVSKQALERAQKAFDEVESCVEKENNSRKAEETPQKLCTEQEAKSLVPPDMGQDMKQPSFCGGFSTAGGSLIAVSKQALEKAHKTFEDLEESIQDKENTSKTVASFSGGFNTAGGNKISVSRKALERAQTIFAEEDTNSSQPGGLTTAVGSKPAVPKTTLENVKAICNADKENLTSNAASFSGGFSTASGSKISVSKQALENAQSKFAEEDLPENVDHNHDENASKRSTFTGGFSTAGGSSIAVSKRALEWAQKAFEEEADTVADKENVTDNLTTSEGGLNTVPNGGKISVSRKALENAHRAFTREEESKDSFDCGLDVRKAMTRFAQEKLILPDGSSSGGMPLLPMFSRASGAAIAVSEDALEKVKQLWNDSDTDHSPARESLAKAKLTRDDIIQQEPQGAYQLKRKLSFVDDEESVVTPTKKLRSNALSIAPIQTSTPAATGIGATKHVKSQTVTNPTAESPSALDVDEFFAQLDDHEFQELFCEQKQKQKRLLAKFNQCADALPVKPKAPTGTTDWDDSFSEILPNLPSSGGDTCVNRSIRPSVLVQQRRAEELQKRRQYVENKPEDACRPREFDFCSRKQRKDRPGLHESVSDCVPVPSTVLTPAMCVTLENVLQFRFNVADYYGESFAESNISGIPIGPDGREGHLIMDSRSTIGIEEMKVALLAAPGIDPRLVPPGWVENAWRWIVTKLSAYERNFSEHLRGSLTPETVFQQLQYRYQREIDSAHRPALRKMLEKDDIPGRRMVLFVSNVFQVDGPPGTELELSDGWYAVRTAIDIPLAGAVRAGKIAIGTKLMIQSAELLNHKEGCSPLAVPPDVRLKIGANACRRARWSVRLGYYQCPVPFAIRCNTIHDRGGLIARFRATIVRVYPLMFVEKSSTEAQGGSVLRSERMQQRHNRRNDASQLENLHKLYNSVQEQLERERAAVSLNRNIRVTEQTTTAELQECLENGLDVSFLDIELTRSQQLIIEQFKQRRQEELQNEINRRVKTQLEKSSSRATVTSLLKVRLMDRTRPDRTFLLSIWRPTDDVRSVLQEQNHIEFGNITANGTKNSDVQLTAHKSSTYQRIAPEALEAASPTLAHFSRCITPIGTIDAIHFRPPFGEFDTVGVVVHVGTADTKKFQSIYLADTAMELLCVNFWHGLAEYAYEDVVRERTVLSVSNLQWRTFNRKATSGIPQSFATEYTTCTENPRQPYLRTEWERFNVQLSAIELETFFQQCRDRIGESNATVCGTPNTTPQQRATSRLQHSTPLGACNSASRRRIETLASIYASPPKMSPIVISRNPSLRRGFKTPARLDVERE